MNSLQEEERRVISVSDESTRLFEEILKGGSCLRIRVTGRSMAPFLQSGETVTIVNVPDSELLRGDLIFFRNAHGGAVLHRIVRRRKGPGGKLLFQTMGDALTRFDGPVSADRILGKVSRIEKSASRNTPVNMDDFFQRKVNTFIASVQFMRAARNRTFSLFTALARAVL
jgi:signal peptidase I